MTSGAIQHGVPTNVRACAFFIAPSIIRETPRSARQTLPSELTRIFPAFTSLRWSRRKRQTDAVNWSCGGTASHRQLALTQLRSHPPTEQTSMRFYRKSFSPNQSPFVPQILQYSKQWTLRHKWSDNPKLIIHTKTAMALNNIWMITKLHREYFSP